MNRVDRKRIALVAHDNKKNDLFSSPLMSERYERLVPDYAAYLRRSA